VPPKTPGGTWGFRIHENGRRPFKGGYRSQVEARRALAAALGEKALERTGVPRDPKSFPFLSELAKDWVARREHTHRSVSDDRGRWRLYLGPHFGKMRAPEVDTATIRAFVEARLRAGMNKTSIGLCVRCLSSFFSDLCERPRETGAESNPVAALPKSLRRLYRSEHDPRFTPYLKSLADVRRLYQALPKPVSIIYAIGVCAGLRTGEILALEWDALDLEEPRLDVRWQIQDGEKVTPKDREARILRGAFLRPLLPILKAWRLETGGRGLLFKPLRGARLSASFLTPHRIYEPFHPALRELGLPSLEPKPFYQATRHSFASHWVRAGHPLGALAAVLGHSTTWVTEHYAHVESGGEVEDPWTLDLSRADAPAIPLKEGQKMGSEQAPKPPGKGRGRGLISTL
jgi:integrase